MTYQKAYDKIIQAYFRDEIRPLDVSFCFCGTLCDNTHDWCQKPRQYHNDSHGYTGNDFVRMEKALLNVAFEITWGAVQVGLTDCPSLHPGVYETALFAGMSAALDVLKEIHRSRGEDVDSVSVPFTKRQLSSI